MKSRRLALGLVCLTFIFVAVIGYNSRGIDQTKTLPVVRYDGVVQSATDAASAPKVSVAEKPLTAPVVSEKAVAPISLDGAVVVPRAKNMAGGKSTQAVPTSTKPLASSRHKFEAAADVSDDRLAEAAKYMKLDLNEFKKLAKQDPDLKINSKNQPLYLCEGLAVTAEAMLGSGAGSGSGVSVGGDAKHPTTAEFVGASDTPPSTYTGAAFTVNATTAFKLHSRTGAPRVIYLDFTGHTTPATSQWAYDFTDGTAFTTPPFQLIGTASPTDQANLNAIRDIWYRVSEHFAAWDVDVTTEQPPATAVGQRCVIGGYCADWLGYFVGGISYPFTFGTSPLDGNDVPNFVFVDGVSNAVNGLQCAASHEIGHTVGLSHMGEIAHDGIKLKSYSTGHAVTGHSGITICGPIMGACYGASLVQWSKGDYPFSNNNQDELNYIDGYMTRRKVLLDDHGDTLSMATVVSGTSFSDGGILAGSDDVDLFKISAGPGPLTISALGARGYPDAKLLLQLIDSKGAIVASSYTKTTMNANLAYTVPTRGNYYVKVCSVGYDPAGLVYSGTGLAQTVVGSLAGWTNYGSMGRYTITGSWQPLFYLPVARIITDRTGGPRALTVLFDGRTSSDFDGSVASYLWDFGDPGSGPANSSTLNYTSHTYTGPAGIYTATLTVRDNEGFTSTPVKVDINLMGEPINPSIHVGSMSASWARITNAEVAGVARIQIVNQYGQMMRSAVVNVSVSGTASGRAAARTDGLGNVTIQMPKQLAKYPSNITFTVTNVSYPGYPYKPDENTPVGGSVTISR